jgi:hypothetical protein
MRFDDKLSEVEAECKPKTHFDALFDLIGE